MAARTIMVMLLLALAPAAALAQPGATPSTSDDQDIWYGGQTLAVDGIGLGMGLLGLAGNDSAFLAGGAIMVLGAPIVHAAHGNGRGVALSLGMRVLFPLVGAGIGGALIDGCDPDCHPPDFTGIIGGALVGLAAASIIDARWLTRERPRKHDAGAVTWIPHLGVTDGGISAGVGGTF